jgi:hypothetical protein
MKSINAGEITFESRLVGVCFAVLCNFEGVTCRCRMCMLPQFSATKWRSVNCWHPLNNSTGFHALGYHNVNTELLYV